MKLALVIASLNAGGAERVASTLGSGWAARGHDVSVLTMSGRPYQPFYDLAPSVTLVPLGAGAAGSGTCRAAVSALARATELRRELGRIRPDAVISFMDSANIITAAACVGKRTPVIATEHCSPHVSAGSGLWNRARLWSYRRARTVVVPTAAAASYHHERGLGNVRHIPHPLPERQIVSDRPCPWERPFVAAMGRLVEVKGFDLLIRAFSRAAGPRPGWRLVILGEGPLRAELEGLAGSLEMQERVELAGLVADPGPVLEAADIFAFSSRDESFGMALAEAMACGTPVVSADCPVGPREIVTHGQDGLLVPVDDEIAFADALGSLMDSPEMRASLGSRATEVAARFSLERVLSMWEELLAEARSAGP